MRNMRVDFGQLAGRRATATQAPNEKPPTKSFLPGCFFFDPVDGRGDVFLLAFAVVELPAAGAGAAEVEAQRGHVGVLQSARGAEDDFVVQRAAAGGSGWQTTATPAGSCSSR